MLNWRGFLGMGRAWVPQRWPRWAALLYDLEAAAAWLNSLHETLPGSITGDQFLQGEGVEDGEAIGVVVKVNKDIFSLRFPIFDVFGPEDQLFI